MAIKVRKYGRLVDGPLSTGSNSVTTDQITSIVILSVASIVYDRKGISVTADTINGGWPPATWVPVTLHFYTFVHGVSVVHRMLWNLADPHEWNLYILFPPGNEIYKSKQHISRALKL